MLQKKKNLKTSNNNKIILEISKISHVLWISGNHYKLHDRILRIKIIYN